MNPKGQIQTVANQRRVGIQKQEEQSNGGTVLRQGLGSYSRSIHNNVFEFYKTGAPTQVKNGNFSLSTIPGVPLCCLTTNQSEESHTPYSPHPKCCLLFLGPSDDHPFRPPVWPYFLSHRGQQFQATLLFLQGWMLVSGTEYLYLDQVKRDFCSARQAYAHAQQEEVTEERDLCLYSQEVSWVWSRSGGIC